MSHCFMYSRKEVPCTFCGFMIPKGKKYVWYDVGRGGENCCMSCFQRKEVDR